MSGVSIVVLTFNRCEELTATLHRLAGLPGGYPVIVVDNGSTDATVDAVRRHFPTMMLVHSPRNLGAAGRNLGVARVCTPYVAFSDDDTSWEAGALDAAARILDACPDIAVLNARILVGPDKRLDPSCSEMAASPFAGSRLAGPGLLGFMAGACVMRTAVFRAVGGYWPPFFIGGEETLMALDIVELGWKIVYAPSVVTWHQPSMSRDARLRGLMLGRNAVWTACMRLCMRQAWRSMLTELAAQRTTGRQLALLGSVLTGLPRALARRRRVSHRVLQMFRQLHSD